MTPGFNTQMVKIIFDLDLSTAKTLEPVRYTDLDGTVYEIPVYQPTDFASTPKAVWGAPLFLIPTGWWTIPCLGHDAAYQNTLLIVEVGVQASACVESETRRLANLTEKQSNDLLNRMMAAVKPSPTEFERLQMAAIYEGVTIGGWYAFKEDRS